MSYAIISLGGKQYRVQEGQRLLVDRLPTDEGKTFNPSILMVGGDGQADFTAQGVTVTARVVQHTLGEKIRIGKYKPKSGYKKHTGYRSRLSQIEIEAIGKGSRAAAPKAEAAPAKPKPAAAAKAEAPAKEAAPAAAKPPKGYEELTVAEVKEGAATWRRPQLEAALAYEQANDKRKGAIAALEAAIDAKEAR